MPNLELDTEKAKDVAQEVIKEASPWIKRLTRLGYVAHGVLYLLVGTLALQASIGLGRETTDPHGALKKIYNFPLGDILLFIVSIGLIGHAIWRFIQAILDTEEQGSDLKGIAQRVGAVLIGWVYIGLAYSALKVLLAWKSKSIDLILREWAAWFLSIPILGFLLVGWGGLIVIGFGIFQIYKAYKAEFLKKLKVGQMSEKEQKWTVLLGRFGFAARGLVFCIIGGLIVVAAIYSDPRETLWFAGILRKIARQTYGPWLLLLIALGLISYGAYMIVFARYRRIKLT
jgi:uncharacterized membrane protein